MVVTKETKQAWLISGFFGCIIFIFSRIISLFISFRIGTTNYNFIIDITYIFAIFIASLIMVAGIRMKPRKYTNKELVNAFSIKEHIVALVIIAMLMLLEFIILITVKNAKLRVSNNDYYNSSSTLEAKRNLKILVSGFCTFPILMVALVQEFVKIIMYKDVYEKALENYAKELAEKKKAVADKKSNVNYLLKEMQKINEKK